jgi:hypothetical protein
MKLTSVFFGVKFHQNVGKINWGCDPSKGNFLLKFFKNSPKNRVFELGFAGFRALAPAAG